MKFSSYKLNGGLVNALKKLGYIDLTEVQEKSLATLLKGKSLIAKSATGSGKTHAYLVPLIQNLDTSFIGVQSLILVPTTELAIQVGNFIADIEKLYPYFHAVSLTSIRDKEEALAKLKNINLPTIVVATPGRVEDIFFNSKKSFNYKINTIVFDEADMLFEDSYMDSIYRIYNAFTPKQVMVFTATMKEHRIVDIKKMLHVSEMIETKAIRTADTVRHILLDIRHLSPSEALIKYLEIAKPFFALVFCSSKKDIEAIYDKLNDLGIKSSILTGGLESRQRKAILKQLENKEINLLLASDVASRGIDFKDVSHVISLDIPKDLDYYYHRAGRTGRINKSGTSVLFVNEKIVNKINKLTSTISFKKMVLRDDSIRDVKEKGVHHHKKNEELAKEIRLQLRKSTSKIKPNYKKKRRIAIEKAKKIHKKKVIRENILNRKRKGEM